MKKKIIIGVAVTILAGGGASAYYITSLGGNESEDSTVENVEQIVEPEKEALFHTLPPLIVSSNYNGSLRYLQVKLSILTRSEETLAKLQANTPLIQNSLIMILDSFEFGELDDNAGKEVLRAKAEDEVRNLIGDDNGGVESVLFTGFVIQ